MKKMFALLALMLAAQFTQAEEIGRVKTAFKLIGPDHAVVIEAFDDPAIAGVTCYVSRAKTGGLSGLVGMAEDPSRFSIACRQVGKMVFAHAIPQQEEVYKESASLIFKHMRVVRVVDVKRNALTYLTYSDKLIDGSPNNAVTAVAVDGQKIPVR